MYLLDRLLHCEGDAWTDALNDASRDDLLNALRRPDLVTRRRNRILDALALKFDMSERDVRIELAARRSAERSDAALAAVLFG